MLSLIPVSLPVTKVNAYVHSHESLSDNATLCCFKEKNYQHFHEVLKFKMVGQGILLCNCLANFVRMALCQKVGPDGNFTRSRQDKMQKLCSHCKNVPWSQSDSQKSSLELTMACKERVAPYEKPRFQHSIVNINLWCVSSFYIVDICLFCALQCKDKLFYRYIFVRVTTYN